MSEIGKLPPVQNLVSYPDIFGNQLFLDSGRWHGVPFSATTLIPDGQIVYIGTPPKQVMIGTRPWTELELARYHARWIVQDGLRDVLGWLGEKVMPREHVGGAEVIAAIRAGVV